eukprot:TRINITY_DN20552_c0_g1_i1.p1 TRINITY_DN20552_c0_g1~~TRINITY_DN20552_c0_g1_i1.p1  ORF type:complete len:312 (+),score=66.77 TRINITY_DN20552_c0_g1_i1:503-1438(+)
MMWINPSTVQQGCRGSAVGGFGLGKGAAEGPAVNEYMLRKPLEDFAGELLGVLESGDWEEEEKGFVPNVYGVYKAGGGGKRVLYEEDCPHKKRKLSEFVSTLGPSDHAALPPMDKINEAFNGYLRTPPAQPSPTDYISGTELDLLESDLGDGCGRYAFLFLLNMRHLGVITRSEWQALFTMLRASTVTQAVDKCRLVHPFLLSDTPVLTQYFCFTFKYCDKTQLRALSASQARHLLLTLAYPQAYFAAPLAAYLASGEVRSMNFDQWKNFVPFTVETLPDASNYSDLDAWPTFYDSFIRWYKERYQDDAMT